MIGRHAILVLAGLPGRRSVSGEGLNWGEKVSTLRQAGTDPRDVERELAPSPAAEASDGDGADALRWLELTGGTLREAVAERLAQAHIRYRSVAPSPARSADHRTRRTNG
jgi:hypothetical protein